LGQAQNGRVFAGNKGNEKSLRRGIHVTEIQIHLISPQVYSFSLGFILILWKILSLIKCVSSAEQEVVCNGNSFPGSRAAPGKSGCLK